MIDKVYALLRVQKQPKNMETFLHIWLKAGKVCIFDCSSQHCNFHLIQLKYHNQFPDLLVHFSLQQSRLLNSS